MKNVLKMTAIAAAFLIITQPCIAQAETETDYEAYSRAHIAFTNLKLLGVTASEYAKCIESVNYLEPAKRHKLIIIGEELFADDGQHYDLKAGDGILTSTDLSKYDESVTAVEPGKYRNAKQAVIIYDASFAHLKYPGMEAKLTIECNAIWLPCSQMTGVQQILCKIVGWPWGVFYLKDCKIGWQ